MGHNSNFLPQCIAAMENSLESIRLQNQLQFTNEACFDARGWVWGVPSVMPDCNAWAVECRALPSALQGQ